MDLIRTDGLDRYDALLAGVSEALEKGKERARQAVEAVRVVTYSEVGQLIHSHVLAHRDRAGYGDQVMGRLAADVGLSERLLYDALRLYRAFGILHARAELGWTHYRALLKLPTDEARRGFRKAALENRWSVRELEAAIRSGTDALRGGEVGGSGDGGKGEPVKRLRPKRGTLYLYRVAEDEGRLVLDVGFKACRRLPRQVAADLQVGDIVRTVKDPAGHEGYRYERVDVRKQYYSYRATAHKVIDGDTLWASVDFGFDWVAKKKLRLRDIDCAELDTAAGQRAKEHVERVLTEAKPFAVTTTKVDLYDRYLTDVFVLPGEPDPQRALNEGWFLNRRLIEDGYARRWTAEKPPEF
jgi:endonuclease YncB( thermonuclease family)